MHSRGSLALAIALMVGSVLTGCTGSSNNKNANAVPTRAATGASAPPSTRAPQVSAQRPQGSPAAGGSPAAFQQPASPPAAVTDVTEQVRFKPGDLPTGYTFGGLSGYQPNEIAAQGYLEPTDVVLKRLNDTGRLGGLFQQILTPDGPSAAETVEVWKDAAGAKTYFDNFPKPGSDINYTVIDLPHPVGDQTFAYQYQTANGQRGYTISWRRGRIVLGIGNAVPADAQALDRTMVMVDALDKKAQAAKQ